MLGEDADDENIMCANLVAPRRVGFNCPEEQRTQGERTQEKDGIETGLCNERNTENQKIMRKERVKRNKKKKKIELRPPC